MSNKNKEPNNPKDKETKKDRKYKKPNSGTPLNVTRSFDESGKSFHETMKEVFIHTILK